MPCSMCGRQLLTDDVDTDDGRVKLRTCLSCDRIKCSRCGEPMPGTATTCRCGNFVGLIDAK